MRTSTIKIIGILVFSATLIVFMSGIVSAAPAKGKTLDNLMTAFNGESNANAKYTAFAAKADEEGFGEVASLFRAAARAEKIHANNHAEVIRGLGGEPKADIKAPEIKSTKENLEDALKGEIYERDTMYPGFIKTAQEEKQINAVRTFTYAGTVEAGHAKLYKDAIARLATLKGSKAVDFYVCTVCGNTVKTMDFVTCPVCANPKDKYIKVA